MKRLIGLSGRAGSGKNTVMEIIARLERDGASEIAFAGPLKRFCQEVFGFSAEQIEGAAKNDPDPRYPRMHRDPQGCYRKLLTPRYAMQTLGTEWGRDCFPDVWADLGIRRAQALPGTVVITDCRFLNEAKAIIAAGGEVWRIVRPGAGLSGSAGAHASEAEAESAEFLALVSKTIHNTGTLKDLRRAVSAAF